MKTEILLILLFVSLSAQAKRLISESGENQVAVLELYSSESCSSCPPADRWVSSLKNDPRIFKNFIPVVFHVDYWNHLGWKDQLSSNLMTDRQRAVAATWEAPAVYTPGVVLNGKEFKNWHNQKLAFANNKISIKIALYLNDDGKVSVSLTGLDKSKKYSVRIARLGLGITNKISSGENAGAQLSHDFVVLDWSTHKVSTSMTEVSTQLSSGKQIHKNEALVAWIEDDQQPVPLQATGGLL